jgi:hypothetical protein
MPLVFTTLRRSTSGRKASSDLDADSSVDLLRPRDLWKELSPAGNGQDTLNQTIERTTVTKFELQR